MNPSLVEALSFRARDDMLIDVKRVRIVVNTLIMPQTELSVKIICRIKT